MQDDGGVDCVGRVDDGNVCATGWDDGELSREFCAGFSAGRAKMSKMWGGNRENTVRGERNALLPALSKKCPERALRGAKSLCLG